MTSQRLVEDYAAWLWNRDTSHAALPDARVPDDYLNEAAVFLAGDLGQRLQRGGFVPRCPAATQLMGSSAVWQCRFSAGHEGEHETVNDVHFYEIGPAS